MLSRRGIEVGHIFYFGTKYSQKMGATVSGPNGEMTTLHMGSYGIGVSRLVGAVIEANHDDKGIVWPASISPFDAGIVNLKPGHAGTDSITEQLYQVVAVVLAYLYRVDRGEVLAEPEVEIPEYLRFTENGQPLKGENSNRANYEA